MHQPQFQFSVVGPAARKFIQWMPGNWSIVFPAR
jgi:hypothetical protein